MKTKAAAKVVYLDEAGIDNREDYPYGYCEVGQRFQALKSGKRTERVSWIAALKQGNIFAPMTFAFLVQPRLIRAVVGGVSSAPIATSVMSSLSTMPASTALSTLLKSWQRQDVRSGIFRHTLLT